MSPASRESDRAVGKSTQKISRREQERLEVLAKVRKNREEELRFGVYLAVRALLEQGWTEMKAVKTIFKRARSKEKGRSVSTGFSMESFERFYNQYKRYERRENKNKVKL